jgi:UDP-GlcNAc:undecaprenyl-phosphate GlcNAc-1-phosphate transferase
MTRRRGRLAQGAGAVAAAGLAAGAARAAYAVLRQRPPGGVATWTRTNHRGEPVTLLEGPAAAAGAVFAAVLTPGLSPRVRAALAAGGLGAAAFGGYDDLAGSGGRRGFRGHLGALARGEVTTGAVKIGGIGATGLVASALAGGPAADVIINTGLTAGGANLLNLFDLRPGRAIKVALAGGSLLAVATPGGRGAASAAGPAGAALALLPEDLGERAMLGDAGANALGAMLGVAAAVSLRRPARLALLAGIIGLTAASEVVSFTAVIERTPALRWADMLGRRPAGPARAAETAVAGASVAGAGMAGPGAAGDSGPGGTVGERHTSPGPAGEAGRHRAPLTLVPPRSNGAGPAAGTASP